MSLHSWPQLDHSPSSAQSQTPCQQICCSSITKKSHIKQLDIHTYRQLVSWLIQHLKLNFPSVQFPSNIDQAIDARSCWRDCDCVCFLVFHQNVKSTGIYRWSATHASQINTFKNISKMRKRFPFAIQCIFLKSLIHLKSLARARCLTTLPCMLDCTNNHLRLILTTGGGGNLQLNSVVVVGATVVVVGATVVVVGATVVVVGAIVVVGSN